MLRIVDDTNDIGGFYRATMFFSLRDALVASQPNTIVIAEDISAAQQKRFYTKTIDQLDHIYQSLSQRHWYECLVESKPSRIFLDVESSDPIDIDAIVQFLANACFLKFKKNPEIEILNSCSAPTDTKVKYSWHVICTNIILENIYHVGAFVRRMVLAAVHRLPHNEIKAIDTAIYTKNRMFRIARSSKFNQNRILRSDKSWYELLVQIPCQHPFQCCEIDGSEPMSTSIAPQTLFCHGPRGWTRTHQTRSTDTADHYIPQISPILDWIDRTYNASTCRHNTKITSSGHYFISTRSKVCQIAKRTHRGNNIWYDIDLTRQQVLQRCYDDECCQRGEVIPVPEGLWSKWLELWTKNVHQQDTARNEKTLYNMTF